MERHGSESYFVIGEGLLGEARGGRQLAAVSGVASVPPFRFSRLGPKGTGKQLGKPNRVKIAQAMTVDNASPGQIPAGYTYLGQFLDHDLTFDKSSLMEGVDIPPATLLQSGSPSLDLDSLYGAGPQDPGSAKFYESDGTHLKHGKAQGGPQGSDLPRKVSGVVGEAIIPDPRNDENLAVAQTHAAFIRFHNRVVDTLPASVPAAQRFTEARELVTKHYQWMVRTDYLPRICAKAVVDDVFKHGRKAFEVAANPTDVPTMPVEFSVAAFRLGHSMIRRAYNWNSHFDDGSGTLDLLFTFSSTSGDLIGEGHLLSSWIAAFRRLYDFTPANQPELTVPAKKFNRAMRIDTKLVVTLKNLPTGSFGGSAVPDNDPRSNLAFRNLTRAKMLTLATGQQMASFLKSKGVTLTPLTNAQLRDGNGGVELTHFTQAQRQSVLKQTPLWFYVLREAELNNGQLTGVGARIVAETFHRAIEGSQTSIVRDPTWRPSLGPDNKTFRMIDLLLFAFEGKKSLLAPLG